MAFDLATAKPTDAGTAPARTGKFDLATARPATDVSGASQIPGATPQQLAAAKRTAPPPEQEDSLLGKIVSPVDTGLTVLSGMVTPIIAIPGGFLKSAYDEKVNGVVRSPEENAAAIRDRIQYKPATNTARRALETLSEAAPVLEALPAVGNDLANLGRATRAGVGSLRELSAPGAAIQNAADDAARAGGGRLRDLVRGPQEPGLSGVGAARSPEATLRQQRAASLGLSPLTEGQATRTPEQVRFERNIAKQPEGAPLNNRFIEHNQQLLQNFDTNFETTGAQAPSLKVAGGVVTDALVKEYNAAKSQVSGAYNKARAAGEGAEPVPYEALADFLESKQAEITTNNAPMLNYVQTKLRQLDPDGTGRIPVNDLEELRKGASRLTQPGTPNSAFIGDVKGAIDASMDQATGSLYQQARRLNQNMANKFENLGAVDKLLRRKPGTNDRAVALEDVIDQTVVRGTYDDLVNVRRALQGTQTPEGLQAWREVQGGAVTVLRDTLFPPQGAQDSAGNILPRPLALKKLVAEMDNDGKLTALFGKQGAEKVRDLADAAVDVNYQTGANTSNTAPAIEDMLNRRFMNIIKAIPGGKPIAEYAQGRAQSKALRKQVDQALSADRSLSTTQSRAAPSQDARSLQDLQRGE